VYDDRSGIESLVVTPVLRTESIHGDPCWVFGPCGSVSLTNLPVAPEQAVGGSILVSGSNHEYVSEVDQLLNPSVDVGSAKIESIGSEPGSIYIMARLSTTIAGGVQGLLAAMSTDVDASDPEFARLHALYDAQFGAGGFNALFKLPNIPGQKYINWDLTATMVTVDQMAVVPEPRMIGLVGLAAMAFAGRRRRSRI
jgi:hypothetical protein